MPFKYGGTNEDLIFVAEGLSEEIVTGLSRFSYLRVIASSYTSRYSGQSVDVRSAGKELNAGTSWKGRFVRRVTGCGAVQLVDTGSGAHLWAENSKNGLKERTLSPINRGEARSVRTCISRRLRHVVRGC